MSRALDRHDSKIRLYLLYGPDGSGSRALAARLERSLGTAAERIDLDGATLKDDPARLADEAAAISLFGARRHIRVAGGDECVPAVVALLESAVIGNPVVIISGALKPASALLKLTLDHPDTLTTAVYRPEGANADELAMTIGRNHGVRIGRDIARALAASCLGDRAILEREIEKLALYLDAAPDRPREADAAAMAEIGAGLDEPDAGALVNAALEGRLAEVARELAAIDQGSAGSVPALRSLARRIMLLARMRSEVDAGKSPGTVVARHQKLFFYKETDHVGAQLSRWTAARLRTASSRVFAAEAAIKAKDTAGEIIAHAEFMAIARVAHKLS